MSFDPEQPRAEEPGAEPPVEELVVEAEAEPVEGQLAESRDAGPMGWRAPIVQDLPENPLLPPRRELSIDQSVLAEPPPEPPEFAKMRLGQRRPGLDAGPKMAPGGAPRATAYDRRQPVGRTRWHQIFEPNEDDFLRRVRRKEAYGAAEGAALFALIAASMTPFGLLGILAIAVPGALAGFVAVRFGQDSAQGWSVACLLAAATYAFGLQGPFIAVLMGAAGGFGWLVGMTREWRMTVDA